MLIVALVLAVIGLIALVVAVVTTNEVIAWVCIAASAVGVVLLVADAIRERRRPVPATPIAADDTAVIADDTADDTAVIAGEVAAEESAMQIVDDSGAVEQTERQPAEPDER